MRTRTKWVGYAMGSWLALCGAAVAQEATAGTSSEAEDLAKVAQNPLATMVTLPLQANFNNGFGPYDRQFFNLNIQPVIPFKREKWNIIARAIIPVNSLPQGETDSVFGIGDTSMTLFWSPAKASKLTWGAGPIIGLPTASNPEVLGSGKFGLGPSAVLFYQTGRWTMGGLLANLWSVAGDSARDDTSLLTFQWFVNYNFGGGWALGSVPIVTANWEAESGNQWTIPWGLQVSKITRFGSQPVNLLLGYYYNSDHPEGAAESQVRVQVNFMFPPKAK
ncbi:MAG: neuromedin U [Thermoanaerobaculia bacterium]